MIYYPSQTVRYLIYEGVKVPLLLSNIAEMRRPMWGKDEYQIALVNVVTMKRGALKYSSRRVFLMTEHDSEFIEATTINDIGQLGDDDVILMDTSDKMYGFKRNQ